MSCEKKENDCPELLNYILQKIENIEKKICDIERKINKIEISSEILLKVTKFVVIGVIITVGLIVGQPQVLSLIKAIA